LVGAPRHRLQRGIMAFLGDLPYKATTLAEKIANKAQELELSEAYAG
jgi:hypothetical protein